MDKCTEISFQFTRFVDGKAIGIVTLIADTEADVPEILSDRWETGSLCYIAETHDCKVLNHERQWV